MDHEGPIIRLDYVGYPRERYVYLPPDLLELLYKRFEKANPSGVAVVAGDEDLLIARRRYSDEELDALYEQRKAFVTINVEEAWMGYPHMRTFLPELYDPNVQERLANDPWLDCRLLRSAEKLGPFNGGIPDNLWVDRSSRWSPEWRAYCDALQVKYVSDQNPNCLDVINLRLRL